MSDTPADKNKVIRESGNQSADSEQNGGERSAVQDAISASEPVNRTPEETKRTAKETRSNSSANHSGIVAPAVAQQRQVEIETRMVGHTRTIANWTRVMAFGAVVAAFIASLQFCAIQQTVRQNQVMLETAGKQANAAQVQANASQRSLNLAVNSAAEQSNVTARTLELTGKSVNATEKQANASMSQANTSQASARAAESSAKYAGEAARVSEQSLRAWIGIEDIAVNPFERDKPIAIYITWRNDGNTPAKLVPKISTVAISSSIPDGSCDYTKKLATRTRIVSPHNTRIQQLVVGDKQDAFRPDQIENVKSGRKYLWFCGQMIYTTLGKTDTFPICSYSTGELKIWLDCVKQK